MLILYTLPSRTKMQKQQLNAQDSFKHPYVLTLSSKPTNGILNSGMNLCSASKYNTVVLKLVNFKWYTWTVHLKNKNFYTGTNTLKFKYNTYFTCYTQQILNPFKYYIKILLKGI